MSQLIIPPYNFSGENLALSKTMLWRQFSGHFFFLPASIFSGLPTCSTKGTFHAKIGTIKDRDSMDLTEAEDVRRSDKNSQKNSTKKIIMTQITTMV